MAKKSYKKQIRTYFTISGNGEYIHFMSGDKLPLFASVFINSLVSIISQVAFYKIEFLYEDYEIFIKRVGNTNTFMYAQYSR